MSSSRTGDRPTPRKARATIVDVATDAGVHWSTVSRALNPQKRHLVSDKAAARVRQSAEKLGYRPNTIATALRTQRSRSIGVIVPNLGDPIHPPIVQAIEDLFAEHGYVTLIGNTGNDPEREAPLLERLIARGVDGLILATLRLDDPLAEIGRQAGVPMIAVYRDPQQADIPSARVDDALAMEMGVRHLADLGHRRIAHVAGQQDVSTGRNRLHGFRHAFAAHVGGGAPAVVEAHRFAVEDGEDALERLLGAHPETTAVVAANDMLAVGCLRAMMRRGLSCPRDLSLVGMNDMPLMDMLSSGLTTVRSPCYEIGAAAGDLLLRTLTDGAVDAPRVVMAPELILRGTTGAPPQTPG